MTRARTLCLVALLAACASEPSPRSAPTPASAPQAPPLATAQFGDLVQQWTATPGNLFVKRPRPDFGAYRTLRIEEPEIYYDEHVAQPARRDHLQLVTALRAAIAGDAQAAIGLPLAAERGEGVLRVRGEVSELEFESERGAGSSSATSIIQPGGKAMFVLELADDASGVPLLRVALGRTMPGGIYTGPWSPEIDRARQLFRGFTSDAKETLGVVFGAGIASHE